MRSALRPSGRKNYLFAGSDTGGERAAIIYTLIETAKLSDVIPQAWLNDVIARIADHPARKLDELLPLGLDAALSAADAGLLPRLGSPHRSIRS